MKIVKTVKVLNNLGLHIRPAAMIVKLLQTKRSCVYFKHKNNKINARSVMGIVSLAAKKNARITIIAIGEDSKKTVKELTEGFKKRFGEKEYES